jgi:hypothetical protein
MVRQAGRQQRRRYVLDRTQLHGEFQESGSAINCPTNGEISSAPQHGAAKQVFDPTVRKLEYTRTAGYIETDHCEMRYTNSPWLWSVDVTFGP